MIKRRRNASHFILKKSRGGKMKKTMIVATVIFISQFLFGCIAFLPPYHKNSTETVVIVAHPEPIIVEPPVVIIKPPVDPPQTRPIKERPHVEKPNRDRDSGRDNNESLRNSGERKRR